MYETCSQIAQKKYVCVHVCVCVCVCVCTSNQDTFCFLLLSDPTSNQDTFCFLLLSDPIISDWEIKHLPVP